MLIPSYPVMSNNDFIRWWTDTCLVTNKLGEDKYEDNDKAVNLAHGVLFINKKKDINDFLVDKSDDKCHLLAYYPSRRYCREVVITNYLHHLYINYLSIGISHVNAHITLRILVSVLSPRNAHRSITSIR